jgi:hypothetical protein
MGPVARVEPGDRLVVTAEHVSDVLIHWGAPLTTGVHATLPVGTLLRVTHVGPRGFGARPEEYERWERALVPTSDLGHETYDGYSTSVPDEAIGLWLALADR